MKASEIFQGLLRFLLLFSVILFYYNKKVDSANFAMLWLISLQIADLAHTIRHKK